MWTLALALHQVDTSSRVNFDADIVPDKCGVNMNGDVNLGVFNFSNSYLGCRIKQELLATEFVGVSVRNSKGQGMKYAVYFHINRVWSNSMKMVHGTFQTSLFSSIDVRVYAIFCVLIYTYPDCTEFVDGVSEIEFAKYELESERLAYLPGESNATVFPSELLCLTYICMVKPKTCTYTNY